MSNELPPGLVIDKENQKLTIPFGPIALTVTFEEWDEFVEKIDDIDAILAVHLQTNAYQCEACGAVNTAGSEMESACVSTRASNKAI